MVTVTPSIVAFGRCAPNGVPAKWYSNLCGYTKMYTKYDMLMFARLVLGELAVYVPRKRS
jgi:hypothetical protein